MVSRHSPQSSVPSNPPNGGLHSEEEEEEWGDTPHDVGLSTHRPRDPRTRWRYNPFCRLFFCWVDPLFWLGLRRSLGQTDLYAHPSEADSKKLLKMFTRYWEEELQRKECGRKARLWVVICKCLWWRILLLGVLMFLELAMLVSQSIVLGYLSDYFSLDNPTPEDTRDAYLYAAVLVLLALMAMMMHAHGFFLGQKIGMHARIIATAAIYQKVLTLSQVTISQISIGHVVNLASNDVQRFDMAFMFLHYLWITPLHLAVFTYLVYMEVGWRAFLATAFVSLEIPLQICLARLFAHLRFKSARVTDQRVRVMNEVISGIRVIKMYAWENAFRKVVTKLRRKESMIISQGATIRACHLSFIMVSVSIIMFLIFATYSGTGGDLTPKKVFTTLSLLITLRLMSIHFFVHCVLGISEGHVATTRISRLLEIDDPSATIKDHTHFQPHTKDSSESEEGEKLRTQTLDPTSTLNNVSNQDTKPSVERFFPVTSPATPPATPPPAESPCVRVDGISASWSYEREKLVLSNISLEVNKDSPVLAVVGPVGAGKHNELERKLEESQLHQIEMMAGMAKFAASQTGTSQASPSQNYAVSTGTKEELEEEMRARRRMRRAEKKMRKAERKIEEFEKYAKEKAETKEKKAEQREMEAEKKAKKKAKTKNGWRKSSKVAPQLTNCESPSFTSSLPPACFTSTVISAWYPPTGCPTTPPTAHPSTATVSCLRTSTVRCVNNLPTVWSGFSINQY